MLSYLESINHRGLIQKGEGCMECTSPFLSHMVGVLLLAGRRFLLRHGFAKRFLAGGVGAAVAAY